jgi:SAM-dependent methyltransferase
MTAENDTPKNWFDQGGKAYARFRPEYPAELARFLAGITPVHDLAVDVGCGTGQLTIQLARYFDEVIGVDPSADQIAHAVVHERTRYLHAQAERIPIPESSVNLITVAQAVHWFDLPAFYSEVRRIAADRSVIALVSYGVLRIEGLLQDRFSLFYDDEIGPFWPPERKLVDNGYRDLHFPFDELAAPEMAMKRDWSLNEFLGYLSTWSAVQAAKEAGREDILTNFAHDLSQLWGDPVGKRPIVWPINMRVGKI